jgi:thioredoxin-related protein
MKKLIVLMCIFGHLVSFSQDTGIKWSKNLTWSEVLNQARTENKCIFLECFATWCMPCHAMDKDVFPKPQVGEVVNGKFICVKVQMDKTNYDDEQTKKWYFDAKTIEKNYAVTALPTFLFFSPEGKPLHRSVGYRGPKQFISLVKDALDPKKQYYALLNNYRPGKLDTAELKGLARALKNSGGELASKLAVEYLTRIPKKQWGHPDNIDLMIDFVSDAKIQQIASAYLSQISDKEYSNTKIISLIKAFKATPTVHDKVLGYLKKLNNNLIGKQLPLLVIFNTDMQAKSIAERYISGLKQDSIFTEERLRFIASFMKTSKDLGFKIFINNMQRVDSVINYKNYVRAVLGNVIINEEYNPFYSKAIERGNDSVPWDSISNVVRKKYGNLMSSYLNIYVKANLYGELAKKSDRFWHDYINYNIDQLTINGTDTAGPNHKFWDAVLINSFVWKAIFMHSNDTSQLQEGLKLMEGVIRRNPTEANHRDTYANILYKLGKINEAIEYQKKAIELAIGEKEDIVIPSLKDNLAKMIKGEPTWKIGGIN